MPNRTKITPEKEEKFLEALAKTANVTRAAESIGISRRWMYDLKDQDETFAKAWHDAVALGTKALEDEATRRASEGWDEPVFYQGDQVGVVRKFSDTLLIFLLKARDPKKYRERMDLNVGGQPGNPVGIITAECTVEEATRAYNDLIG